MSFHRYHVVIDGQSSSRRERRGRERERERDIDRRDGWDRWDGEMTVSEREEGRGKQAGRYGGKEESVRGDREGGRERDSKKG